jgi:hypothetical protein
MGVGKTFGEAFYKAIIGSNERLPGLPTEGETKTVFISVRDSDKGQIAPIARQLVDFGFKIVSTTGTQKVLSDAGIESQQIKHKYNLPLTHAFVVHWSRQRNFASARIWNDEKSPFVP